MASPADFAGVATVGVTFPADAGVTSLVDPAGSIAGGVTDLSVPVHVLFGLSISCCVTLYSHNHQYLAILIVVTS